MSQQYAYQQQQPGYQPPPPGFNTNYPTGGYAYPPQQPYAGAYAPPPQPQFAPDYSSGGQSYNVNNMPANDPTNTWAGFSDKNVRRLFIQKVYSLLALQLFVTFALIALFVFTPAIKGWARANVWTYYIGYVIFFVLYLVLMCCEGPRRSYPTNFVLLGIFTLALSYMAAMISVHHEISSVVMAAGITCVCCTSVSLLSFYTKFDFTRFGWALFIASIGLFIAGIIAIIMRTKIMFIVYAAAGTVIFMLFLAYDTQLICGGKKYELSPEEYILGCILLYVDIVYIFLMILQLIGLSKD